MTRICDLHTHSTASDGQYSPASLAEQVRAAGVQVWALTDHDTLDGLEEAAEAGKALGLRVIRGIELGAREYPGLHILGYGFSQEALPLRSLCAEMRSGRDARKHRIIAYLREKGAELSLEEVESLAKGGLVARPHFARALTARGYTASVQEAFDRYLDTPEFFSRVERPKPTARECLEIIHAAGGMTSLAHPYQTGLAGKELERLTEQLTDWGLDAIECYYPRHSSAQTEHYLAIAKRYGLHVSGGSDFHGETVKPDVSIAAWMLETDWLEGESFRQRVVRKLQINTNYWN